ncbi:jg5207 [Pararge aegeria aegeria]|uniref:Jg5207 protein n=1 Tax=Pararge aegeria aegeria TaxID=348720 RepID=A0A8S4QY29_9NEOP|nr:jg5207 [Pararge aegeria aegeria]
MTEVSHKTRPVKIQKLINPKLFLPGIGNPGLHIKTTAMKVVEVVVCPGSSSSSSCQPMDVQCWTFVGSFTIHGPGPLASSGSQRLAWCHLST